MGRSAELCGGFAYFLEDLGVEYVEIFVCLLYSADMEGIYI